VVAQDTIVRCVSDVDVDASIVLAQKVTEEQRCDVLALRGLLACGILEHSLQLRHLVDYGVNRCRGCAGGCICVNVCVHEHVFQMASVRYTGCWLGWIGGMYMQRS
jgi:hypothetical protein